MRIIVLLLYAAFSTYDCVMSETGGRRVLKPLLMPLLVWYYVLAVQPPHGLVIAALLFDGLGDTLLIGHDQKKFKSGVFAFGIAHILFSVYFRWLGSVWEAVDLVPAALIACYFWYVFRQAVNVEPKVMRLSFGYGLLLSWMSFSAFQMFRALGGTSIIVWIGTVLFILSDSLIALHAFRDERGSGVMETYALAQALVVLGLAGMTV
jgi:uncharacterized membrane protein YhhN